MSQLDRLTGIKNLRVRSMFAVSFAAYLKATGINIIRAMAYRNRETGGEPAPSAAPSPLSCAVKEQLQRVSAAIQSWNILQRPHMQFVALYAA
jgi:hypothetical protein